MFAKLFSRITESSLMEEIIEVRYTFMTLLAISDPQGYVIGTDVAIARRLNMPLELFAECVGELMQPDLNSNSKEEEGRRVIPSDHERGYKLVNYRTYRDMQDEGSRREYMKTYMQRYRGKKAAVNNGKLPLAPLGQAEAEAAAEAGTATHAVLPTLPQSSPPKARVRKKVDVSERGAKFATWFRTTLPADVRLSSNWEAAWGKCYDDMLRIDKRTREQVHTVCQWARVDAFWAKNFLSPMKLRDRDGAGTMYFDVFTAAIKSEHEKTTRNDRNGDSPRNVGHNANVDYSKRPARTSGEGPGGPE